MAHSDYEESLERLDANGVRYLIVGAHALGYHARPRATEDLDVFHEGSLDSAERILKAMREFLGGATLDFSVDDLIDPDIIAQLGVAPVRIDLLSSLAGIGSFDKAWASRVDTKFGRVDAHYLSLDDLIRCKEAAGRDQDKADVGVLRRAKKRKR